MSKIKQGFTGSIGTLTPLYDKDGHPKYNSGLLWTRIPLFDFRADAQTPFIYTDKFGTQYMPDSHFETDGGSVPPVCQIIPFAHLNPLNFPKAYIMHDGIFQFRGLYVKYQNETTFKFRLFDLKFANDSMADWLHCDDCNWWTRRIVLNGLVLGSWTIWNSKKAKKQLNERKKARIDVYDKEGNLIEDNGGIKNFL